MNTIIALARPHFVNFPAAVRFTRMDDRFMVDMEYTEFAFNFLEMLENAVNWYSELSDDEGPVLLHGKHKYRLVITNEPPVDF